MGDRFKVLITGSRDWSTDEHIQKIIDQLVLLPENTIIVHGAARGVDNIAAAIALEIGFQVIPYPADWIKYKKAAGPIRNREMHKCEAPFDLVLAFHDDLKNSKGTKDMVSVVEKLSPMTKILKIV